MVDTIKMRFGNGMVDIELGSMSVLRSMIAMSCKFNFDAKL